MKKHTISFTRLKTFTGYNVITTFLTLAILSNLFISSNTQAASYTTSVSTSGALHLNVSSNGNGANLTTDNLNIISTCPAGYTVSISARSTSNSSFSDTTLYKDGDKTNTADTEKISPSTGTIDSPVSILDSNKKTWGYTTETNATTNSNSFVGLTSTQTNIISSNTGTTATGTSLPIHYGVSIDNTIEPGIYKMSDNAVISYFLTASLDCTTYQVAFNPTSTAGGTTLSGTGTMQNQRIAEGTATNLASNTFTAPIVSGTQYYFAGWNTAQDGTGTSYTNGQSVTDLTTAGNTITLYAQWTDCPSNSICYEANGNNIEGTVGLQEINSSDTKAILMPSNYSRSGYGFAGWSNSPDPSMDSNAKIYGPNESITFDAGQYNDGGLILYAVWVKSEGTFQDSTKVASLCGSNGSLNTAPTDGTANLSSISALTDNRDNQTYAIAKLADGNCWMIENLRLDNTAVLTTVNTNNPLNNNESANPIVTLKHNYVDTETYNTLSASSSVAYNEDTAPDGWCNTTNQECYEQSRFNSENTANRVVYTKGQIMSRDDHFYSYGNYYNWYSATAGRGIYDTYKTYTVGDICPSGWKMPYGNSGTSGGNLGGTSGGFSYLDIKLGGNGTTERTEAASVRWRKFPNNYIFSGWIHSDARYSSLGVTGIYWTRTSYTYNNSHYLYFSQSEVNAGLSNGDKGIGLPVRCLVSV